MRLFALGRSRAAEGRPEAPERKAAGEAMRESAEVFIEQAYPKFLIFCNQVIAKSVSPKLPHPRATRSGSKLNQLDSFRPKPELAASP